MSTRIQYETAAEHLLRRDRWITVTGLILIAAGAWAYVLDGAGTGMSVRAMSTWSFPPPLHSAMMADWTPTYWAIMLGMWWVMMIAMMIPSATPMVLLYARVSRHAQRRGRATSGATFTATFLTGYLLAWLGFSVVATGLQWLLEYSGTLHGMFMWSINRPLTAGLLLAAGLYQFSGAKRQCLEHCRSPAEYLSRHWLHGRIGALRMGLGHGAYCLGCCWALMALLFVGGAMNLVWIAGLSIVVLIEKLAPFGHRIGQALGIAMIVTAAFVVA